MKRHLPIHPIFFALYPTLFIFSETAHYLSVKSVLWLTCLVLIGVLVFWGCAQWLLRNVHLSALITTLVVAWFFMFRYCKQWIQHIEATLNVVLLSREGGIHRPFFLAWMALFALGIGWRLWRRKRSVRITPFLNILSVMLVCIALSISVWTKLQLHFSDTLPQTSSKVTEPALIPNKGAGLPNIYFIVLDAHGRADVLQKYFDYDSTFFIDGLEQRGFYVAKNSRSNYSSTHTCLASVLNMTYLDALTERFGEESVFTIPLTDMINDSIVVRELKQLGYTTVAFETGYEGLTMTSADILLAPPLAFSEFGNVLFSTTPLPSLLRHLWPNLQHDLHRNRILDQFDKLATPSQDVQAPYFFFAHLIVPHPPYIFGPNGEERMLKRTFSFTDTSPRDQVRKAYRDQVEYVDKRILSITDEILAQDPEAIIIIQGDHGPPLDPWVEDDKVLEQGVILRIPILNAVHLPGNKSGIWYDHMTPVNTFRALFNAYFGINYTLLEDHSYISFSWRPFKFKEVTDLIPQAPTAPEQ